MTSTVRRTSRLTVRASIALAVASTASVASAQSQYTLQKANSFSLSSLFTAGTGYGSNPLSVTVDNAGNAYVGGYNSSAAAANIGIVKVSNVLGVSPTLTGLVDSQFSSPSNRGLDGLASTGGDVYALHDAGTTAASFIERVNTNGTTVWKTFNPGAGTRASALAIDPTGDAGNPAVGFLGFGQGRRATLKTADGTLDYTFSGGAKPGGIINASPALSNQGNFRALAFDAAGNIATGAEAGFGVGTRVNENRWSTLDGATLDAVSRVIVKGTPLNNVGNGIALLEGAATDELIIFSPRATGSGAGGSVQLTNGQGGIETVNSKYAQIRQTRGQPGYLTQRQLTGAEDGLGSEYISEVKNFAVGVDANGNPALYVVDYLTKQLDVYTIEPRYSVDADSTWSTPAAWTLGIVPNSRTTNATFGNNITAARTVTLDGDKTVKQLKFDSAVGYTIGGTNTVTLSAPANDNHNAYISVLNGSHTVNAPIALGTAARFDVTNAADTLTVNTVTSATGALAKRGLGTASVQHIRVNALAVENGIVRVRPNATEAGISRVSALTLGTTGPTPTSGVLDLTNNGVIVDYDALAANPYADLKAAIQGGQITSSTATIINVIGIVDYTLTPPPTFLTDPALVIDSTSVFIRATLKGDANLTGKVDFDDLVILAQNYNRSGDALYQHGDSNYDGNVNFDDLVPLAQNYNASIALSELDSLGGSDFATDYLLAQSLVPEPTSLLALGAGSLLMRRHR